VVAACCIPCRDHQFDDGFVQGLMVRVCQNDLDLVRSWGKTDEDEGLAAGVSPVPRRIIHDYMDVSDAGRHIESIWAKHRYDPEILGTILDKDHALGEWSSQGRIYNDLRRGLRGCERYDAGRPEHVARSLRHGGGRVKGSSSISVQASAAFGGQDAELTTLSGLRTQALRGGDGTGQQQQI
jgi:hypothetical protein